MPSWLAYYPGAKAETRTLVARVESTYTTPATPDEVIDHYRKVFEGANLRFLPNFDRTGTAIRGAAAECDLLIVIRKQIAGTLVRVSCAAKSRSSATSQALPEVIPRLALAPEPYLELRIAQ